MTGSLLDMERRVGVTVHIGGLPMTRALLSLCHADEAHEILEVGCGIGVGLVHAARSYGRRVVGIDVSERMVAWARRRVREEGVEDRVDVRVADVLALPFEDGRFDVTFADSVLGFVADKERAIAEMVRVTKPGGYVGVDEMFLRGDAPSPRAAALTRLLATEVVGLDTWTALWEASGLAERLVRTHRIDFVREVRRRLRWVGGRWSLRAVGRIVRLYVTLPELRPALRLLIARTPEAPEEPGAPPPWAAFGYALLVGRKPLDEVPDRNDPHPDRVQ